MAPVVILGPHNLYMAPNRRSKELISPCKRLTMTILGMALAASIITWFVLFN